MVQHDFDYNFHHTNGSHDLHTDINTPQNLHENNNLLDTQPTGFQPHLTDLSQIETNQPSPLHNPLDSQTLTDFQANSSNHLFEQSHLGIAQSSHIHGTFDNQPNSLMDSDSLGNQQFVGDSQSNSLYSEVSDIASGQNPNNFDYNHALTDAQGLSHQRQGFSSGSSGSTPSSPSDIRNNHEVTFTDSSGKTHEGTVTYAHINDNKFDVQTTDGQTINDVPYSQIDKYRSK